MKQLVYAFAPTKNVKGENEYAFGLEDGLPWGHIKRDMLNFAARTKDTILICGAKTFMSFPEPLKGRKCIVVQDLERPLVTAKNGFFADAYTSPLEFTGFLGGDDLTTTTSYNAHPVFFQNENYSIIGGAKLLMEAYDKVDRIVQTTIRKKHYIVSDVKLPMAFIIAPTWEESGFVTTETHWYAIDELTNITETVYERR